MLSASVSGRECKSPATNHRELALQIGGERARQETDASSVTRAKVGRWARGISALDLVVEFQLSQTLTKQKRTEPDLPPPSFPVCMRRERKRSATGSARAGALAVRSKVLSLLELQQGEHDAIKEQALRNQSMARSTSTSLRP